MKKNLEEFIFTSKNAKSTQELCLAYEKVMAHYGFDQLAYTIIDDSPKEKSVPSFEIIHIEKMHNWAAHYIESNYYETDITTELIKQRIGYLEWENIANNDSLSIDQRNIFNEAKELNLHNGITFSIHGPGNLRGCSIAASSHSDIDFDEYSLDTANIMTYQFHLCLLSLKDTPTLPIPAVSKKEQEILKWTSMGMTKLDISKKLHLSPHTIDYHIRSILKKLNAKNIVEAVVLAIKNNLIII